MQLKLPLLDVLPTSECLAQRRKDAKFLDGLDDWLEELFNDPFRIPLLFLRDLAALRETYFKNLRVP